MDTAYVARFSNTVDTIFVAMGFLPFAVRQKLRHVNSRWNLAVSDSVSVLRCTKHVAGGHIDTLVDSFPEVRSLSLRGCLALSGHDYAHLARLGALTTLDLSSSSIDDIGLDYIVSLRGVTSLNLNGADRLTDEGVFKLRAMPQLLSLDIRRCFRLTANALEAVGITLAKLETLSVDGVLALPAALRRLRRFPRLTSLAVIGINEDDSLDHVACLSGLEALDLTLSCVSDTGLAKLCQALPRLTALTLRECHFISNAGMKSVSRLSRLTSLDIGWAVDISNGGTKSISRLPLLTTLRLDGCANVTDAGLAHIAKLTQLTELDLKHNDAISDAGVGQLASLTQLRVLDLSCANITDASFFTIERFPRLTSLKLASCRAVSHVGLQRVARLARLADHRCQAGRGNTPLWTFQQLCGSVVAAAAATKLVRTLLRDCGDS